jgi:hypothetical protein
MDKRSKAAITASADQARRYVDGYRRDPETAAEVGVATTAAMSALGAEPWDAEG